MREKKKKTIIYRFPQIFSRYRKIEGIEKLDLLSSVSRIKIIIILISCRNLQALDLTKTKHIGDNKIKKPGQTNMCNMGLLSVNSQTGS